MMCVLILWVTTFAYAKFRFLFEELSQQVLFSWPLVREGFDTAENKIGIHVFIDI